MLRAIAGAGIEDVQDVVAHDQSRMPLVAVKQDRPHLKIRAPVAAAEEEARHTQRVDRAVRGVGIAEDSKIARAEDLVVGG